MGTGPLPDWLHKLAHAARGQAMVTLDTYQDNLCLWRCRNMLTNCPKTSLDELEKVEMHLNKGAAFSDWLGIRVYVPERVGTEVVWHLTRNPAA